MLTQTSGSSSVCQPQLLPRWLTCSWLHFSSSSSSLSLSSQQQQRTKGRVAVGREDEPKGQKVSTLAVDGLWSSPAWERAAAAAAQLILLCGVSMWAGYQLRPRLRRLRHTHWHRRERRLRNPSWLLPSFAVPAPPFQPCGSGAWKAPHIPWWAVLLGPRWAPRACESNLLSHFRSPLPPPKHHAGAAGRHLIRCELPLLPAEEEGGGGGGGAEGEGGGGKGVESVAASPNTLLILAKQSFTVLYHPRSRSPLWSGFFVTNASVERAARQRRHPTYYSDPVLPHRARWSPAAYKKRGYDRGHLAPHAAVAVSERAALEAAMMTNIVLQDSLVNRRLWRRLEALPRAYVKADATHHHSNSSNSNSNSNSSSDGGGGGGEPLKGGAVNDDAALLERLVDWQAVVEKVPWGRARRRRGCRRQLAICTGPLFLPEVRRKGTTAASEKPSKGGEAVPRVPSSFFTVIWNPDEHWYAAFIVPNHRHLLTDARTVKGKRCGSARAMACDGAGVGNAVDDAERWFQLLRAHLVPLRELEIAFAASLGYIAGHSSGSRSKMVAATGTSSTARAAVQVHLLPLHQARCRWRRWLHPLNRTAGASDGGSS